MEGKFNTKEDAVARAVIGAAIEVPRCLGPGSLECVYEQALCHELALRRIPFQKQQRVPISYKGVKLDGDLRYDVLVAGQVLLEIKAKEILSPTDKPQFLTYLRLLDLRIGLLINFHTPYLKTASTASSTACWKPLMPMKFLNFKILILPLPSRVFAFFAPSR